MKNKFTKEEKSWISYDWANSVFATNMMAAIFPIYFTGVASAGGVSGDFWWGVGASISTAIIAVFSQLLGVIGHYKGFKKKMLSFFLILGLVFTAMCAFVGSWQLMLVGYVISSIGFSGANLFYDSLLTDVTTAERMDRVSAWGYSMGYIGGSTIPFLISIALITFGEGFGIDTITATKASILITVVWWAVFSIPLLKNCKQKYGQETPKSDAIKATFISLGHCVKEIVTTKSVFFFVLAYFFYIDGVNTVIKMSTAYGASLGLDSTGMILALLVTQLVAFPCAILFGKLSKNHGTINMLLFAVVIYLIICTLGFIMGFGIEEAFLSQGQALTIFWILATLVGTVQGGIQALSRSYFGKLIPKEKSNEYFGVFDIFGKFAAVIGPAIYSTVLGVTGRSSFAIFAIAILFIAGGTILLVGRKYMVERV